ncbi:MAG: DUF6455 family protein [Marivita sp.]|uniref:DUF6455 family protein n=1 Tax=Marivita sp. TaxID=2003365 RepID=UPI0025C464EB|nr:DUF6455 family protein [Marivita sp.]MCI5110627.1 DUF6455 family protein [Marivita sp.]
MSYDSKRDAHTKLVLGMADRQGVDLEEILLRGEILEDQFEDAVNKCLGCTQPVACKCLLDTAGPQINLPDYCRNGDLFDSLAPK